MLRTRHPSTARRLPTSDGGDAGLSFEEHAAESTCERWVATYWTFTASPHLRTRECWSAADPCTHLVFGEAGAYVAGPQRETLRRAVRPGERRFGVRLQPGTARALLHIPPSVPLRDTQVPLDRLPALESLHRWSRGLDLSRDLADLAASAGGLIAHLVAEAADVDGPVTSAAALLSDDDSDQRIASIAARLGLSARQLRRRFHAAVDLTPSEYRSILRFRRCVHALLTKPASKWSGRAADAGFADQSHLIREFRRFGRMAPAEFERRLRNVTHRRPWSPRA